MTQQSTLLTLQSLLDLNNDLTSMSDGFIKLLQASKLKTEESADAASVPGDLFDVLVEKLVHRSELALQRLSGLKKDLVLGNESGLAAKVKDSQLQLQQMCESAENEALKRNSTIAQEMRQLLTTLEDHYYTSSAPCTQAVSNEMDADLQELCMKALHAPFEVNQS